MFANGRVIVIGCPIAARANIDARSRYGAASVPGPAGFRESAEFERLEAEVRRMDADGPAAVDRGKFSTLSLNFVSSQSKDVLVACWASYGFFQTGGYRGLAVGLGVLQNMVDAHWKRLYLPTKRERVLVGAIDWLVGRFGPEMAKNPPTEADYPAMLTASDVLDDLHREMREELVNGQVIERAEIALRTGRAGDRLVRPRRQKLPSAPHRQNPLHAIGPPSIERATNHKVSCSCVEAAALAAAP
ncbi:hypothetical protein ACVIHH_008380 [Bradyrhizobium sp. USDA 4518]